MRVRRPCDLVDFLAIVIAIFGEAASLVIRRGGNRDVARTMFIEHPGHRAALGSGRQVRRKRCAENLFESEFFRRGREGDGARQGEDDEISESHTVMLYTETAVGYRPDGCIRTDGRLPTCVTEPRP